LYDGNERLSKQNLVRRMLTIIIVYMLVSVVVAILLILKWETYGYPPSETVALAGLAIVVPAMLGILFRYLYWRRKADARRRK